MKHFIYFSTIILFLSITYSCSNDIVLDNDSSRSIQYSSVKEKDSLRTRSYCYGCLPMITAYHDSHFNQLVIAWSGYTADLMRHSVTISYTVNGSSHSRRVGYSSGEIRENVYSDSYTAKWSVSCNGSSDCQSCKSSGSILKRTSGEIEEGSYNDCHKNYLQYSIESIYNDSYRYNLVLVGNTDLYNNTEKYMTIDRIKVYKIDPYTYRETECGGVSLKQLTPFQLQLVFENQSMGNYEIRLFSSRCENSSDHYYSVNYSPRGLGPDLPRQLWLIKNH